MRYAPGGSSLISKRPALSDVAAVIEPPAAGVSSTRAPATTTPFSSRTLPETLTCAPRQPRLTTTTAARPSHRNHAGIFMFYSTPSRKGYLRCYPGDTNEFIGAWRRTMYSRSPLRELLPLNRRGRLMGEVVQDRAQAWDGQQLAARAVEQVLRHGDGRGCHSVHRVNGPQDDGVGSGLGAERDQHNGKLPDLSVEA